MCGSCTCWILRTKRLLHSVTHCAEQSAVSAQCEHIAVSVSVNFACINKIIRQINKYNNNKRDLIPDNFTGIWPTDVWRLAWWSRAADLLIESHAKLPNYSGQNQVNSPNFGLRKNVDMKKVLSFGLFSGNSSQNLRCRINHYENPIKNSRKPSPLSLGHPSTF